MRNKFILSFILSLLLSQVSQEVFACHAMQLQNLTGVINGNVLEINGVSDGATCGCGNYSMQVEIICANQNYTGLPNYYSTMGPKANCDPVPYPTLYVPLSNLCPGTIYKWRVREGICEQPGSGIPTIGIGPWSSSATFTTPGTPPPPATITTSAFPDTILIYNGVVCNSSAISGFAIGSCDETIFNWDNGLGTGQTKVVSPNVTTTYTVTSTDLCSGATASETVTVYVEPYLNNYFTDTICPGDTVNLIKTLPPETFFTPVTFDDSVREPVRDFATGIGKINVSGVNTSTITPGVIASICFTITHTRNADLEIRLRCPSGSLVDLSIGNGGNGMNYSNACMDENASQLIQSIGTVSNITGSYVPQGGGFGALNGCNVNGLWTLEIYDNNCNNEGELVSWSITFNDEQPSSIPVFNWNTTYNMIDTSISSTHVFPDTTTSYILSSQLQNCTFTETYDIVVNPKLIQLDAYTGNCTGDSVQINATGGLTYNWSPTTYLSDSTIANPYASNPNSTNYYVTGIDANGCNYIDSTIVVIGGTPAVDAGADTTVCYGSIVQLDATGGNSFEWYTASAQYLDNDSIANPTTQPSANTTFHVIITDSIGCSNIDSVFVGIIPSPTVNAGVDDTICVSESATLNATGTATNYLWTPSAGLSNTTSLNPVASPSATTTYYLRGENSVCFYIDTVTVFVNTTPTVTVGSNHGPNPIICPNDLLTLEGTGGGSYSWSPASAFLNPNIYNPTVVAKYNGAYVLTVYDANGCSSKDSIFLQLKPAPGVNVGENVTICAPDNSTQLNAVISNPNDTYSWNNTGTLSDPTILNPFAIVSTTTTYILNVTNSDGCTTSDSVTVILAPGPVSLAIKDSTATSCFDGNDGTANLTATGGTAPYNYSWNPALPNLNSGIVTGLSPGFYIVEITDDLGCKLKTSVTIDQPPAMELELTANADTCGYQQGNATVSSIQNGTSPYNYVWSTSDNATTQTVTNLLSGYYAVTVTDSKGCEKSDNVLVPLIGDPIQAEYTASAYNGVAPMTVEFSNNSLNSSTYLWTFENGQSSEDKNPATVFENSGVYHVLLTATNEYCIDTVSSIITVLDALEYEIPNIFTPNGDGKNDIFTIAAQGMSSFHGTIYSRWGRKVYEWEDSQGGWDGKGAQEGVYYYVITFTSFVDPDQQHKKQGHVTLIK